MQQQRKSTRHFLLAELEAGDEWIFGEEEHHFFGEFPSLPCMWRRTEIVLSGVSKVEGLPKNLKTVVRLPLSKSLWRWWTDDERFVCAESESEGSVKGASMQDLTDIPITDKKRPIQANADNWSDTFHTTYYQQISSLVHIKSQISNLSDISKALTKTMDEQAMKQNAQH